MLICVGPGPTSSITLTTGSVAERPHENWSVVASYASGLHGMTRALALDLKPIRVNLVSPGGLDSELWSHMPSSDRENMYKYWAERNPTGHAGRVEEVAEAYLWLMKDTNVTGRIAASDSGAMLV
jgi:NAD(P)-dependent dehydrogenase (short-subunit alcohol dehydrogenase family)